MKQREKMLLGGLVASLALWQGSALLNTFVFGPVEQRESDITARNERISSKEKQVKRAQLAARKLKEWNQRSLPPDPVAAASLYQTWLIELAGKTGLENVEVEPARSESAFKAKAEAYSTVSARIKAKGTLSRLCDFLFEFRRAGLLHRVARLELKTDQHQGDPPLEIEMTVEGLSLKDAPPRTTLLSDPKLAELPGDRSEKERKDYAPLTAKNLFVRGYNGPPRRFTGQTGEGDPREFVYFVGAVSAGAGYDATLYDRANNKATRLTEGSTFNVAELQGKVLSIAVDSMTLEIKGETWQMDIGTNLLELKKLPPAPAKAEAANPSPKAASGAG